MTPFTRLTLPQVACGDELLVGSELCVQPSLPRAGGPRPQGLGPLALLAPGLLDPVAPGTNSEPILRQAGVVSMQLEGLVKEVRVQGLVWQVFFSTAMCAMPLPCLCLAQVLSVLPVPCGRLVHAENAAATNCCHQMLHCFSQGI
jgi:hypothetical protein